MNYNHLIKFQRSPEGFGNVGYDTPFAGGSIIAPFAQNGLQITAGVITLGGPSGSAAAAKLIFNTEIPMNNFSILYSGMNNAANFIWKDDVSAHPNYIKILGQNSLGQETFRLSYSTDVAGDNGSIFVGLGTGAASTGTGLNRSTMFGFRVGQIATTAFATTFFGYESLTNLSTGQKNTGLGDNVLNACTTGSFNSAFGSEGMQNIATGNNNTGVGAFNSQGWKLASSDNTCVGTSSGNWLGTAGGISANQNCLFGSQVAQLAISCGSGNILIGYNCINVGTNVIGNNNIFIGASITATGTPANTTLIGQGLQVAISNVAIFGRSDQNVILCQNAAASPVDLGSKLQVLGSISLPLVNTAVGITADNTMHTIILTAGGLVVTLPAASTAKGRIYAIMNQGAAGTTSINYLGRNSAPTNALAANTATWIQSDNVNWNQIN